MERVAVRIEGRLDQKVLEIDGKAKNLGDAARDLSVTAPLHPIPWFDSPPLI